MTEALFIDDVWQIATIWKFVGSEWIAIITNSRLCFEIVPIDIEVWLIHQFGNVEY